MLSWKFKSQPLATVNFVNSDKQIFTSSQGKWGNVIPQEALKV